VSIKGHLARKEDCTNFNIQTWQTKSETMSGGLSIAFPAELTEKDKVTGEAVLISE